MSHRETIAEMYAAFGRGDVPAVLSALADDVDWEYTSTYDELPLYRRRRGKSGAAEFFAALGDFNFNKFNPTLILEAPGGLVIGLIDIDLTLKANGARIAIPDEVHLFYFNAAGKVAKFCHRVDTFQFWKAMQA